ncbi:hypothetical protein MRX96_021236 [Rhipicephalus microplus]
MILSLTYRDYVKSTHTLRKLRLTLGSSGSRESRNDWRETIFTSLSRSKSKRDLSVPSIFMSEEEVHLLADSVVSSRSIKKVHFSPAHSCHISYFGSSLVAGHQEKVHVP